MHPGYDLLWLTDPQPSEQALRVLARSHPGSRAAAHVSRSYRLPFALTAWHEAPVGVDLERVAPTERGFAESICTPAEISRFGALLDDDAFVSSLWASKEALAKALGDARAYDPRRLESPFGWTAGAAGPWRAREFVPCAGHVAWLVWSETAQKSPASARSAASTRRLAGLR